MNVPLFPMFDDPLIVHTPFNQVREHRVIGLRNVGREFRDHRAVGLDVAPRHDEHAGETFDLRGVGGVRAGISSMNVRYIHGQQPKKQDADDRRRSELLHFVNDWRKVHGSLAKITHYITHVFIFISMKNDIYLRRVLCGSTKFSSSTSFVGNEALQSAQCLYRRILLIMGRVQYVR